MSFGDGLLTTEPQRTLRKHNLFESGGFSAPLRVVRARFLYLHVCWEWLHPFLGMGMLLLKKSIIIAIGYLHLNPFLVMGTFLPHIRGTQ